MLRLGLAESLLGIEERFVGFFQSFAGLYLSLSKRGFFGGGIVGTLLQEVRVRVYSRGDGVVSHVIGGNAGGGPNTLARCRETEPQTPGSIGSWGDILQSGFRFGSMLSGSLGSFRGGLYLFPDEFDLTNSITETVLQIHGISCDQA